MTKANRLNQSGQVMSETLICILLICLVFFGLLQIFQLSVAQMLTDYGAWCAARSRSVGFNSTLTRRAGRIASIGASGRVTQITGQSVGVGGNVMEYFVFSTNGESGIVNQFYFEKSRIPYYASGEIYLEYDHWMTADETKHNDGEKDDNTHLAIEIVDNDDYVTTELNFVDYPMSFLTGDSTVTRSQDRAGGSFFFRGNSTSIRSGEDGEGVTLRNHAGVYMTEATDGGDVISD